VPQTAKNEKYEPAQYFAKTQILVPGRANWRSYQDEDGETKRKRSPIALRIGEQLPADMPTRMVKELLAQSPCPLGTDPKDRMVHDMQPAPMVPYSAKGKFVEGRDPETGEIVTRGGGRGRAHERGVIPQAPQAR